MLDVKNVPEETWWEAAQQVEKIVADAKADVFPTDVKVTIANDQSTKTINQVDDLVNKYHFRNHPGGDRIDVFPWLPQCPVCWICHPHVHVYAASILSLLK